MLVFNLFVYYSPLIDVAIDIFLFSVSLFSVVSFENAPCVSSSGLTGSG